MGRVNQGGLMKDSASLTARLEFLKFLAASPHVASVGGVAAFPGGGYLALTARGEAEPSQRVDPGIGLLKVNELLIRFVT